MFTFPGVPVGYLSNGSVYSFSGAHLGWFENRLVRDGSGSVALFTDDASGGPLKPLKQLKPLKGLKQLKPLKGLKVLAPLKPLNTVSWSNLSGVQFFG